MLIFVSTPALVEVRWSTGSQVVLVRGLREDSDGHLCSNHVSHRIYIEHLIEIPVLVSERHYILSHCLRHIVEDLLPILHSCWYSVS